MTNLLQKLFAEKVVGIIISRKEIVELSVDMYGEGVSTKPITLYAIKRENGERYNVFSEGSKEDALSALPGDRVKISLGREIHTEVVGHGKPEPPSWKYPHLVDYYRIIKELEVLGGSK